MTKTLSAIAALAIGGLASSASADWGTWTHVDPVTDHVQVHAISGSVRALNRPTWGHLQIYCFGGDRFGRPNGVSFMLETQSYDMTGTDSAVIRVDDAPAFVLKKSAGLSEGFEFVDRWDGSTLEMAGYDGTVPVGAIINQLRRGSDMVVRIEKGRQKQLTFRFPLDGSRSALIAMQAACGLPASFGDPFRSDPFTAASTG